MKVLIKHRILLPALIAALGLALTGQVWAQTFTPLYSLNGARDGATPGPLVLSGNTFYGTTTEGGAGFGTVFKVGTNGQNYTTLYTFTNGTDGNRPGGLVLLGNTLYGVTSGHTEPLPNGTLFSISTSGFGFTNFYTFAANGDGIYPSTLIVVSNLLYGTTYTSIFVVNTNGSGFIPLYTFGSQVANDGSDASGALLLVSNTLYGTTVYGGPGGDGTIYSINTDGSGYTNFFQFQGINDLNPVNSDGAFPRGGLVLAGSTLYGTAGEGGTLAVGTLFAINTNGTSFTNLFNFGGGSGDYTDSETYGYYPNGSLVLSNDVLYGTTSGGGDYEDGALFSITTNGATYLNLHSFSGTAGANSTNADGGLPGAGITLVGNSLYGTAGDGGTNGSGTIFDFSLTPVPLSVATPSSLSAGAGLVFNLFLSANGGQRPYTWALISGALPPNMSPLEDNYTYGYPQTIGTYDFTVQVTDTYGAMATQAMSVVVTNPDNLVVTITNATPGMVVTNVFPPFILQGTAVEVGPLSSEYVYDVYYSLNNSAWASLGTPDNGNWSAYLSELIPGNNTIAVYATDTYGSVSSTDTITLNYQIPASSLLTGAPGTPVSTNWNPGNNPVQIEEGGGIGVVPLETYISPNVFSFTAVAGDVVFLLDPNGGEGRNNWAAVVRFFNPNDPTGVGNVPATESQTFYPANPGPNYFAGFQSFPRVAYLPIAENVSNPFEQGILAAYDEIGPVDGIFSGQLADFEIFAEVQPTGFTATITSPPGGGSFVGGSGALTVFGVTTLTNGQAAVTNVYVQLNGGSWISATQVVGWTNWTANFTVLSGTNTVAAYAVDQNGNVSPTNSVTFDYYTEDPADAGLTVSAAPEPVAVGSDLVYSITVSNAGPGYAEGLIISNQLPANVTFVSASGGYLPSGGVLAMSIGGLNVGETNLSQIIVQPTAAGLLTNLFLLSSTEEADPDLANNSATVVSTVTSGSAAPSVVRYEVFDLGLTNEPISVNNKGEIVGATHSAGNKSNVGLYWTNAFSPVVVLSQPGNAGRLQANHISNDSRIVGEMDTPTPGEGLYWTNGASLVLDIGGADGTAISVNDAGQIVGTTNRVADEKRAVYWASSQITPVSLTTLGGTNNQAIAINASGAIVGEAQRSDGNIHAAFWLTSASSPVDLGTLGGTNSEAIDINDAGHTVGDARTSDEVLHAAFWTNSTSAALLLAGMGSASNIAAHVNSSDEIVGALEVVGATHAVLWTNSTSPIFDLNNLIASNSGWTLLEAVANNDLGEIVGIGVTNGVEHGFALIPVAGADLSITASAAPNPVGVGSNLVYSITVSNAGPSTATSVVVSNQIPANVTFVSATGGATPSGGILLVNLGSLAAGATGSAQMTVQPTATGPLTSIFEVSATQTDPNLANNSATVITTVTNAAAAANVILYTVVDLGLTNEPLSLNNNGQIVGSTYSPQNKNVGLYWASSSTPATVLAAPAGATSVGASHINDAGQIVGEEDTPTPGFALYWTNSTSHELILGTNAAAVSINLSGEIVGWTNTIGSGQQRGVYWANRQSVQVSLATLGGPQCAADSINSSGEIAGVAGLADGNGHAAVWASGASVPVDLGTLGSTTSRAYSINDPGAIVGSAPDSSGATQPVYWTNSSSLPLKLGTLGGDTNIAYHINNVGQIVGSAGLSVGLTHAVYWTNSSSLVLDLNNVINTNSGWVLLEATCLNDLGEIVGLGMTNGQIHAFALFPVNPPTTADLSISLALSAPFSTPTDQFTYDLTVSNAGPATATGVVISNQVPSNATFESATGGITPVNGVLLVDVGTLAPGATNEFIVTENPVYWGDALTNTFSVSGNQVDPNLANNSFTNYAFEDSLFSTSTLNVTDNIPSAVPLQTTNYTTELIAVMPGGAVVYSNSFSTTFSDPSVQAAITLAAEDLTNSGASAYTGPSETGSGQGLQGVSAVSATNFLGDGLVTVMTEYVGPTNFFFGPNQSQVARLYNGADDLDTLYTTIITNQVITTNTSVYTNVTIYTLTGIETTSGADLSISASPVSDPVAVGTILYYLVVATNAGPSTSTNVVITNTIPANTTFVSVTGGAVPTNGVLLVNIGNLAAGAARQISVGIEPSVVGPLTNLFAVSSATPDPVSGNNSVTVISRVAPWALTNIVLYNVVDLGDLGANSSAAVSVNNPGQIVGFAKVPGGVLHAAFWTNILTPPLNIGDAGASLESEALSINNSGQIVGFFTNSLAAFWAGSASHSVDLGTLGGSMSKAASINDSGQIVGSAETGANPSHAAFWTNGSSAAADLGTLGGKDSAADSINAAGLIVGNAEDSGGQTHAVFWTNSSSPVVELNDGGSTNSSAICVNDLGQIVGGIVNNSFAADGNPSAGVFWTNYTSPPYLMAGLSYSPASGPVHLNHSGQIVGESLITNYIQTPMEPEVATLWPNASSPPLDLNTAIPTNSGWILLEASGINDSGVIVGAGLITSADAQSGYIPHAFALIPITQSNSADLSITAIAAPLAVAPEGYVTNFITVRNAGPSTATGVVVSNQIPADVSFVSATGGATPSGGILLINLGSLAVGATDAVQVVVQPTITGQITNTFEVSASQTDPDLANNSTIVVSDVESGTNTTTTSTSEVNYETVLTTNLSQQVTNQSTELIAKLPNGTVVYDQTFAAAYSDPAVQTAVTQAAADLNGAGAASYTGPTQTSSSQTLVGSSSFTVTNTISTNISFATTTYIGPKTITIGQLGTYERFATNGSYTGPTGGNPQSFFIVSGGEDIDTLATDDLTISQTTTLTDTNLDSSVYVMTGIVPQATVELSITANGLPNPVGVGSNLTYSITVSNATPNFQPNDSHLEPAPATDVTISNRIPAGVTFVSATGGATPGSDLLLMNLGSLSAGATASAQVIVKPTLAGQLTNWFAVFADQSNSTPANGLVMTVNTVTNETPPTVDVALGMTAVPAPVEAGTPLTYSLTVTNNSVATAPGVVVSNTLPANVTLNSVLPSVGSYTTSGREVTVLLGSLANGTEDSIAIVVIPNAAGQLTNEATVYSTQTDSVPANNSATNITTAVAVPITNLVLTVLSGITLNPQTGLFQEQVKVFNGGPTTPASVLVLISGLGGNITLYNATGTTNGTPYVQSPGPLGVGSNIVFLLEYYSPTRTTPHPTLTAVAGPAVNPPVITGTVMGISRTVGLSNGDVLVEFATIPGRIYAVQYSSDLSNWQTALPVITAPANRVQWIDAGPPGTASSPATAPARYYRVVLLP